MYTCCVVHEEEKELGYGVVYLQLLFVLHICYGSMFSFCS